MALPKQELPINFSQGLDLKSDPKQVSPGRFLKLQNTIFDKGGLLQKRNGFGALPSLPNASNTFLTTFNGNLTALGTSLNALSAGSSSWVSKGAFQPVKLDVQPLYRSSLNQSQADVAIASNGLSCLVFTDNIPSGGSTNPSYKYIVADSVTGQQIIAPTVITPSSGTVTGAPKVFLLGNFFVILLVTHISATYHIQYIAINSNIPSSATTATDITTQYTPNATTSAFDGFVANNNLYIAWNGSDGGGAIRMTYLDSTLTQHGTKIFATQTCSIMSVCADTSGNGTTVYATYWDTATNNGYILAVDGQQNTVLAPTQVISSIVIANLTASAKAGVATLFYEVVNAYGYNAALPTNYIRSRTCTQGGSLGSATTVLRSVGLAAKSFICNSIIYLIVAYGSQYQPSYFMCDSVGNIIAKLAYSNGGGYSTTGLPHVSVTDNIAQFPYLFKDLITSVNKTQGVANTTGIYSQTGINLATFEIGGVPLVTAEIGLNLHITGGFLTMYDGAKPVEHGFHVWPDTLGTTIHLTGGGMVPQQYYYIATYEWNDNQGNTHRSAPSLPISANLQGSSPSAITFTSVFSAGDTSIVVSSVAGLVVGQYLTDSTTGGNIVAGTYITSINSGTSTIGLSIPAGGNSASTPGDTLSTVDRCSVTVNIPTLRLTAKTTNPVKLVLYRWSVAQQTYYQVTSVNAPLLNDMTVDSVAYVDTLADQSILGNAILYTTGGVIENIAAPASSAIALFQSRLVLIPSEDQNLLWISKQVIENTPVELSDLLTIYTAPTTGAQGSTGPTKVVTPMDDKLILFKKDAAYYIAGQGPDNTGANNQYSDAIFITSTVGCENPASIVFIPSGIMFQSDKGIWLLGRDLSTSYIGAPVADFNDAIVQSAINVPGTNQVRFTLDNGITLMYDYYYNQWGVFVNVPAISSTLYQGFHTYINDKGMVYQETPGLYLDGSNPVLISFKTGWMNLAGLQGFERAYFFYLIGTYISPHKLSIGIAYDYESNPSQNSLISPDNYNPSYGNDAGPYGSGSPYGGKGNLEQWRVFLSKQKCQAFQISLDEIYDPSYGVAAGAGFTMSGINLVVGAKGGYPRLKPSRSVG